MFEDVVFVAVVVGAAPVVLLFVYGTLVVVVVVVEVVRVVFAVVAVVFSCPGSSIPDLGQ